MSALDPSTHFGFWAWKKGTGKSFLFGRRSWKKRYFVLDRPSKMVSYWESQSHQTAQSPPLKPPLSLEGATVELPDLEQGRDKEGRIVFPFTLKFPVGSNSDKSEMRMRAEDKATREAIVAFLQKCGVKVVGGVQDARGSLFPTSAAALAGAGDNSSSGSSSARPSSVSRNGAPPMSLTIASVQNIDALREKDEAPAAGSSAASSGSSVAPARAPSMSKTPPPPPARYTSSSLGISKPDLHSGPAGGSSDSSSAESAPPVPPAAPAAPAPAPAPKPAPAPPAPAPAATGSSSDDEPAPPRSVPKPSPPPGPPPPEVEEAARDAQLRRMAQEEHLPPGWTMGTTADGFIFYVSPEGESTWEKPTATA